MDYILVLFFYINSKALNHDDKSNNSNSNDINPSIAIYFQVFSCYLSIISMYEKYDR